MRTKLVAAAAIALGATALTIPALTIPAHATTAGECQGLIAVLSADTSGAQSLTAKAKNGLVDKAEAAAVKLDAGKVADAHAKLTDYDSTLHALHSAAKPKVSDADFALLNSDVDAALGCVASIGAP